MNLTARQCLVGFTLFCCGLPVVRGETQASPAARDPVYRLEVSPLVLVTDETAFVPFARTVGDDINRMLRSEPIDPARRRVLLTMRVHLAIHFREWEVALASAAELHDLQPDGAEKDYSGVTTAALVAAHRERPDGSGLAAAFREQFSARLAALPSTPALRAMLVQQRVQIGAMTKEALLAEIRDEIAPAIARRGTCTFAEADRIVRARHKLADLLPLRSALESALDTAIAARPEE